MTIFSSPLSRTLLQIQAIRRLGVIAACLSGLFLVGCAGVDGQKTAGSGISGYSASYDWRSSNDPIGEFLARTQNGGSWVPPADINHPLAAHMMTQLGIRYRYGGKSPDMGFDCSGLVGYSASQSLGLKLPPRSDDMAKFGNDVNRKDLQVGDLVFFNTLGRRYSHVGVYIGEDHFVHSPAAGGKVRVENMNQRYWDKRFTGARRLDVPQASSAR